MNADALFEPGRWTLNPDAAQTLDALVAMIHDTGGHPLQIQSYALSSGSHKDNEILAEKRGLTVRGWLSNRGYISPNTPVHGSARAAPAVPNSPTSSGQTKKEQVQLIFDTCR